MIIFQKKIVYFIMIYQIGSIKSEERESASIATFSIGTQILSSTMGVPI